jgi:hypothetical protein
LSRGHHSRRRPCRHLSRPHVHLADNHQALHEQGLVAMVGVLISRHHRKNVSNQKKQKQKRNNYLGLKRRPRLLSPFFGFSSSYAAAAACPSPSSPVPGFTAPRFQPTSSCSRRQLGVLGHPVGWVGWPSSRWLCRLSFLHQLQ